MLHIILYAICTLLILTNGLNPDENIYNIVINNATKCPYISGIYKTNKELDFLKECNHIVTVERLTDATDDTIRSARCILFYNTFLNCSAINANVKKSSTFEVSNITYTNICDILSQASQMDNSLGSNVTFQNIKDTINCYRMCTGYDKKIHPLCNASAILTNITYLPIALSNPENVVQNIVKLANLSITKQTDTSTPVEKPTEANPPKVEPQLEDKKPALDIEKSIVKTPVQSNVPEETEPPPKLIPAEDKPDPNLIQISANNKSETKSNAVSTVNDQTVAEEPSTEKKEILPGIMSDTELINGVDGKFEEDPETDEDINEPVEKSHENSGKPIKLHEEVSSANINAVQDTENDQSYFFSYFMTICIIFVLCYVGYHNKQKILALILEGRKGRRPSRTRRPNSANYHKLDSNLEEAVTSSCNKNTTPVIY